MDWITDNFTAIVIAIIGIFAGVVIKIRIGKKRSDSNVVTQTKNKVKGDIAGRDIHK
ncbi:MAG: hypothetical protein H8E18_09670 [FCB group bacterium]|nr:hypothetical protein [FCB group bacterium]